jgi:hypothetical protein
MNVETEITLNIGQPTETGAASPQGYKIYRDIRNDPCPDGVVDPGKEKYHSNTIPNGDITWVDQDTEVSTPYYYRVSWLRNDGEEFVGELYGPFMISSLYELAYPGNSPSPDSGNPNFVDVEPIVHFDATYEMNTLGQGEITKKLLNLSDNWQSLINTYASGLELRYSKYPESSNVPVFAQYGSTRYNDTLTPVDSDSFKDDIIKHWGDGSTREDINSVVFDEGLTICFAVLGNSDHALYYDENTDTIASGANGYQASASGHTSINGFSVNDERPTVNIPPRKFSDGSNWVDPTPPFFSPDSNTGWIPMHPTTSNTKSFNNRWRGLGTSNGYWSSTWYYWNDLLDHRLDNPVVATDFSTSRSPLFFELRRLNIYYATIYPDGYYEVFFNGRLVFSTPPPSVLLGEDLARTGSWHINNDVVDSGNIYNASLIEYGTFMVPFKPMPTITFNSLKLFPLSSSSNSWSEFFVFPKALDKFNRARLHNYFVSKYGDGLCSLHKDYSL